MGNKSNVNIAETAPKYSEIPLHFLVFEGFLIILEKRRKRIQTKPHIEICLLSLIIKKLFVMYIT